MPISVHVNSPVIRAKSQAKPPSKERPQQLEFHSGGTGVSINKIKSQKADVKLKANRDCSAAAGSSN